MDAPFLVHHELVPAGLPERPRWMLVLHGILGAGINWRSFARRIAATCPSWGFVLVDLRAHGQSTGAPPPHTVVSAAEDLIVLQRSLNLPIRGVIGHSMGGKVALALADRNPTRLDQVWVLDAQPGARVEQLATARTVAVVRMLERMPQVLPSRDRFVQMVEEQGYSKSIAAWLAMNLRHTGDGYRLRVDLKAISSLLDSYYETDLWRVISDPSKARHLSFVIGGKSDVLSEGERERLASMAEDLPHVHVHTLKNAGHWVHIDDPDGLTTLVISALSATLPSE